MLRARNRLTAVLCLSAAAAVTLLFAACSEQPAAPVDDTPAFNFMNNPDNAGPLIVRIENRLALSWTDANSTLRATHATWPFNPGCGAIPQLDPIDQQYVLSPQETGPQLNEMGEVWIIVRDIAQPGTCFGNLLIASGPGRIHYTDNDVWGAANNAYGFMAQGQLTTPAGEVLHYNGEFRQTWLYTHGAWTNTVRVMKVNLR